MIYTLLCNSGLDLIVEDIKIYLGPGIAVWLFAGASSVHVGASGLRADSHLRRHDG